MDHVGFPPLPPDHWLYRHPPVTTTRVLEAEHPPVSREQAMAAARWATQMASASGTRVPDPDEWVFYLAYALCGPQAFG